ncbi:MAG: hypothetical protein H7335_21885 [Massilia sp.]|nr:hypothetical protein [Massilia sp.]
MQKLMSQLRRLYLPAGAFAQELLEQRLLGNATDLVKLSTQAGLARAVVIAFNKAPDAQDTQHWDLLCTTANALQNELGLPAPAVSISGADGYGLWLSLEKPARPEQLHMLVELLRSAYFPDTPHIAAGPSALVELPPCLHPCSGKWAAFIHPGLGASFAGEPGLDMAPPLAGQNALLEGLHSISEAQLAHAIAVLRQARGEVDAVSRQQDASARRQDGLLLADATLDDIVRHLHAKNIEPTFRHLIGNK